MSWYEKIISNPQHLATAVTQDKFFRTVFLTAGREA